jgi:hypothetical protein
MKFAASVILTALLSFIVGLKFEWWTIALVAFLVALLVQQSAGKAYLAAFSAIFLLWGALALWINIQNQSMLSVKIAKVLPLGGSPAVLILITALIGALVAGFGAMSGSYLRQPKQSRN